MQPPAKAEGIMTEAEAVDPRKLEVLQHLQCVICLDGVSEARLCPSCSRLFCDKCIYSWLTNNSSSCPNCRTTVCYSSLVKGYSINQLQESIRQLFSSMDDEAHLCKEHGNQHLSLFCYPCETNICVKCWFSEAHAEHKERAVPLEEAFEHYMGNMKAALTWINGRKEVVDNVLKQVQENVNQLSQEQESIKELCDKSEDLIAGKASPATILQILETARAMAELRSNHQDETESIRLDRRRQFMSVANVLVFHMPDFHKTMGNHGLYETNRPSSYGFEWKCKIIEEDDNMFVYLTLTAGNPSEYSIMFGDEPEKVYQFELNSAVKIGEYKTVLPDGQDLQKLTIHIRQSYGDRFQQLQDYIHQLEKENAEHVAFKTYLADWDKRVQPASD